MRVMISQPMKGLTEKQIRQSRAEAVAMLESEGHTVIDTVFADTPPESAEQALWYLGKALQVIARVDAVYFMDGWKEAWGCRLEYEACVKYGVKVLEPQMGQQLIPEAFINKSRIDNLAEEIIIACAKPRQLSMGGFYFDKEKQLLICVETTVYTDCKYISENVWVVTDPAGCKFYFPQKKCNDFNLQMEFIDEGTRLFLKLRENIRDGKIKIKDNIIVDFDKVRYSIDTIGRYHIVYDEAPIAELFAAASTLLG